MRRSNRPGWNGSRAAFSALKKSAFVFPRMAVIGMFRNRQLLVREAKLLRQPAWIKTRALVIDHAYQAVGITDLFRQTQQIQILAHAASSHFQPPVFGQRGIAAPAPSHFVPVPRLGPIRPFTKSKFIAGLPEDDLLLSIHKLPHFFGLIVVFPNLHIGRNKMSVRSDIIVC